MVKLFIGSYLLFWCLYPFVRQLALNDEPISYLSFYSVILALFSLLVAVEFVKDRIAFLFVAPVVALLVLDVFLISEYGTRLSSSVIYVAWEEMGLASDFLILHAGDIVKYLLLFFSLILCLFFMGQGGEKSWQRVFGFSFPIVIAMAASFVFHNIYYELPAEKSFFLTLEKDQASLLFGLKQGMVAAKVRNDFKGVEKNRNGFSEKIQKEPNKFLEKGVVVLVIGESSRPQNWSLSGYSRKTNPKLEKRGNLYFLNDIITTAPLTMDAVVSMLSLSDIREWESVINTPSIVSMLGKAGVQTEWISVQPIDSWSGITSIISAESKKAKFLNASQDDRVLSEFKGRLPEFANSDTPVFIVLHTWGSHYRYETRYPKKFEQWNTGSLLDTYDNSVLFTDDVLDELIGSFESYPNLPAAVFYFSDHGENLQDDHRNLRGHPFGTEYDLKTAGFVWASDSMMNIKSASFNALSINRGKKLSLGNLPHSIMDFMGIQASGVSAEKSFFNEKFVERNREYRVWGKVYNYDNQ